MKDLSRAEIGRVIEVRTENALMGTAMLFVAAGSLWAHFGLGPVFLEPSFVGCWVLVHGLSFASLFLKRFDRLLPLASLAGLQLHFYSLLYRYEVPYFPVAPMFFLVAALALTAYSWDRARSVMAFWALGWASTALWLAPLQGGLANAQRALFLGMAMSLIFVGSFMATMRFFSGRMRRLVDSLGPHQRFDEQRIHAARLQALGEIAAGLSHEIHNPLTAINGYSYQIQEDLAERADPGLDIVKAANDRIKFNVDRIIEIAKVMKGFVRQRGTDEMRRLSMREIFADTLVLMKHNLKAAGIELHVDMPEKDAFVEGSLVQLSQVLVNLLSNARDACADSERKRVDLGFAVHGDRVELWVQDTGPGIQDEIGQDVFRAFFTTKPAGTGTGLGLYISAMIAERHGAHLSFDCPRDPAGRVLGTRFVLSLRLAAAFDERQVA